MKKNGIKFIYEEKFITTKKSIDLLEMKKIFSQKYYQMLKEKNWE